MPLSKNLIGHHYFQCIWHYWASRISLNSKHQLKESVFMRVWLWACENPGVLVSYAARATSNDNILEVCHKAFTLHVAAGSLEVGRPRLGLAVWFYFLLQLWLGLTSCLGFSSGLPPVKEQQIFGRSSFHGDDKGIRGVNKNNTSYGNFCGDFWKCGQKSACVCFLHPTTGFICLSLSPWSSPFFPATPTTQTFMPLYVPPSDWIVLFLLLVLLN